MNKGSKANNEITKIMAEVDRIAEFNPINENMSIKKYWNKNLANSIIKICEDGKKWAKNEKRKIKYQIVINSANNCIK